MKTEILKQLLSDRASGRAVVLATVLEDGAQLLLYPSEKDANPSADPQVLQAANDAQRLDLSGTVETSAGRLFLNVFNPPLRMIVVGAVHISQALAPMAALAGFSVTVIDPRRSFATTERFPDVSLITDWPDEAMAQLAPDARTAVVTLTHDPKLDDPALSAALSSEAFYIGALGSRKTHNARLERLSSMGFSGEQMARIHGPVGLSIGAKSPAEIAVSIVSEVIQSLRERQNG